jgi:hypothetical protein
MVVGSWWAIVRSPGCALKVSIDEVDHQINKTHHLSRTNDGVQPPAPAVQQQTVLENGEAPRRPTATEST